MNRNRTHRGVLSSIIRDRSPSAYAQINGSEEYRDINGTVNFYVTPIGVIVSAEVNGLPHGAGSGSQIFGFHIHEGFSCMGSENEPFSHAGGHYSKVSAGHPFHSGDLPPLFGNDGYAWYAVLTDRFSIEDIIGRTVIIHADPDDFTSQPSGKSGKRIACGVVLAKT